MELEGTNLVVKPEMKGSIHEKSIYPVYEERVEAPVTEYSSEVVVIDVVKEAQNVKEKGT